MNLKQLTVGAIAALSLGLAAVPAHAYIFGSTQGAGAMLILNDPSVSIGGPSDPMAPPGTSLGGPIVLGVSPDPVTGWYDSTGYSDPFGYGYAYIANSATDVDLGDGLARNNFFVFDISGLTTPITSGGLRVFGHDVTQTDLYRLGSYTGGADSIDSLEAGSGGVTAFNDLANGKEYAKSVYYAGDTSWRVIALNDNFVTDINDAILHGDTRFVLGGTIGELEAAIPEPASWALMILGFLGTGVALRARRRASLA